MADIIEIGFSPCPNDTFIFDALINKRIDTGDLSFQPVMEDVETLNNWALQKKLAVTKLSYGVFPLVMKTYALLDAGSALGSGVGPLLIRNRKFTISDLSSYPIAIPGENTTAHLLLSLAYPQLQNKIFVRYDEIEQFVLDEKGFGVIIHENRFTYKEKGLEKITDLGNHWEAKTGKSIPLGGIVIDKEIETPKQRKINELIRKSIEYAYENYPQLPEFVTDNAQEMSEDIMRQHIDLYVNKFSLSLGVEGREAVQTLLDVHARMHNNTDTESPVFVLS